MNDQLSFDLPLRKLTGRDDFFVSDANALAVQTVDHPELWPQCKLVLNGPKGSGKSHLAEIWAADHGADFWTAGTLPTGSIVVDDIDTLAGDATAEEALFHTHNHALANGYPLLMTSTKTLGEVAFDLPDLNSRLAATQVARISEPDDVLMTAVILKHFAERQITPPAGLIDYVVPRIERSFNAAREFVSQLDALSLARGQKINRKLATQIVANLG